jgi:hypothetical protein
MSDESDNTLAVADAQSLVARSHGFESWSELAKHTEGQAPSSKE